MIKTLIDEFHYPRLGPGQMWEVARDKIKGQGGAVHLDRRVIEIEHDGGSVKSFLAVDREGRKTRYLGSHFLSTLPVRDLIRAMRPSAPAEVVRAAESLRYRDFLTVVLIIDRAHTLSRQLALYPRAEGARRAGSRTSRTGRPTSSPTRPSRAWV